MSDLDQSRVRQSLVAVLGAAGSALGQNRWRLVGTAAALLQGVELPCRDVDLLVRDREDVDAFAAALAGFECLVPPTYLAGAHQYYCGFSVSGVEVEASTVELQTELDGIETFGPGPWEHYVLVDCENYRVPAVALELRLVTELNRGREERSAPLIEHMRARGCDPQLVRRGLEAAGIPADPILEQLAPRDHCAVV